MARSIIVIPCYNEALRFPMAKFNAFVEQQDDIDFLLVNDGSTDHTLTVLEEFQQVAPHRIAVWNMPQNRGKSEAVRQGVLAAFAHDADYVGYWDADLATPLDTIPDFVHLLDSRPELELICGARVQLLGRSVRRSRIRHYLGRVFATAASTVLGLPIYDTQCGAKLFRATPRIQSAFVDKFHSRWLLDVEILARLMTDEEQRERPVEDIVCEVPLQQWHDQAGSKVKPLDFPKAFCELASLYVRYFRSARQHPSLAVDRLIFPSNLFAERTVARLRQPA